MGAGSQQPHGEGGRGQGGGAPQQPGDARRPLAEGIIRGGVRCLPVDGLAESSRLGLVWRTDSATPQLSILAQLPAGVYEREAVSEAPAPVTLSPVPASRSIA